MKISLLIFTLFTVFGNVSAQDSTSNATWTQTTDWIKIYKNNS